ncbi:hypothetical protein [Streptomyces sp. A012304]|uniref:hypothetical protein n=1 Tax=Streptomyces sp. A012304 TaxID=375446 RepID=UPI00223097F6|nr:hypothetical protein [Streptomyces sp. A012304]GKQ38522.1 hypothetical protein ALMP_50530 [Streptomyces sp. A012304]
MSDHPDDPHTGGRAAPEHSFRDNRQRLDQGLAVMGGIGGDANVFIGAPLDETVTDRVVKPRLREGPYPADDVQARLRGFVEPPAYARCRKVLDGHVLVLRAGGGTGASTTAFALLAERHGADGVTGLDSPDDLARWRPTERRGYLLQGLSPTAAASLGEVVLTALAQLLRRSGAHLVVTVRTETALPGGTTPWQVVHDPPSSAEVAAKRLRLMITAGDLTPEQGASALRHLAAPDFAGYLRAHPLPGDGVEVAEELRDLVVSGKPAASVLAALHTGSPAAARRALAEAGHEADRVALMAAIALLSDQDRTVIEEFCALLRPRIEERGRTPVMAGTSDRTSATEAPARRDVLGPAFEERLEAVGARLLPPRQDAAQRYPVQPVVFTSRHRSDALLRCLWLDYEGMANLLLTALYEAPHHSGVELAAGRAIGKVLVHATGPGTLRQLHLFAASERRRDRRLVAYALGEMVQHPPLTGAVRAQLQRWSRASLVPLRCTVAETCAGSYGLARPAAALNLLDSVLDGPGGDLEASLTSAVSLALSTLLSEDAHHPLVLDRLLRWQTAGPGTRRHALAVHAIESMSLATFPRPHAPGVRRVRLADLLHDHPGPALDLVVAALDDPALHEATAAGLALVEDDPDPRHRAAFGSFLGALAATARGHRGVLRFFLHRHRARGAFPGEGSTP